MFYTAQYPALWMLILGSGSPLLLIVLYFFYIKTVSKLQNRAHEMLDSQVNIVIITEVGKHLKEANRAFLNFFGYASLEEFHKEHECICDRFIPEDGYLQKEVDGMRWVEYVATHPKKRHIAKIADKDGTIAYFRVHPILLGGSQSKKEYVVTFEDITNELATQKSLEIERDLFSDGPVVTIEWSPKGNWPIEYVSKNVIDVIGYTPEEMMAEDFDYAELIHPDDLEQIHSEVVSAMQKGIRTYEQSYRLRLKSGEYRHFYDFNYLTFDANGNPSSIRGYLFDNTEVVTAQQRFHDVAEASGEYIWEIDNEGRYTFLTKPFEEMSGYTIEESLGRTPFSFMPTEEQESVAKYFLEEVAAKGVAFRGLVHPSITKDGKKVWQKINGLPIFDKGGAIIGYRGAGLDITKEREAQELVKIQKERLQNIIDGTNVGTWEWNIQTGETIFNEKWAQIIGYTLEEISPTTIETWIKFSNDEDLAASHQSLDECINAKSEFYEAKCRMKHKDGHEVWVYDRGKVSQWDKDGNALIMSGTHTNIDAEERAKEKLALLNKKLKEAIEAKSQFLANMSHEIRTPMNAILGLSELLRDTPLTHKQSDFLDKIHGSSQMLLGIINDILDFSKLEAKKLELEHKSFALEDLFSQLHVLFATKSAQQGLELYFYHQNTLPYSVFGDKLRLTQVATNLLSNALKFTSEGLVIVSIHLKERRDPSHVLLEFSIKDSGIGITEEQQKKIFSAFSQADSSTTRKYGGTGLGLMISSKIVEAMGSNIKLESTPGEGSRFYFDLECEVDSWQRPQELSLQKYYKILIVDDQEISREILKEMLQGFGCSCDEACDGEEAIEKILLADSDNTPYDFVLVDWMMPKLDGKEMINRISQMHKDTQLIHAIPSLIMISAHLEEKIDLKGVPIESFLSKPVTVSTLLDALMNAKSGFIRPQNDIERASTLSFAGKCILLVEDNEINQEVATLMLQRADVEVIVASNGKEAVATYFTNREKIDLILMDLQMPIMGGYEATKEIRKEDSSIPIIALTAAAMVEDREKVLASGMNDHLGKPIDTNELYSKLSLYFETQKSIQNTLEIIDEAFLFKNLGSDELIERLLKKFILQLQGEFSSICTKIQTCQNDAPTVTHTLKGVSANLGALRLTQSATKIDACYKNKQEVSQELIDILAQDMADVINSIQEKYSDAKS